MTDNIILAEQLQFDFQLDSQTCTTEEQSKRLLDLGLKIETADMKGYPSLNREVCISCTDLDYYTYDSYPAWSLHRLICLCDVTTMSISRDKIKNAYEYQIFILETLIKTNQFNKEYLIDKP